MKSRERSSWLRFELVALSVVVAGIVCFAPAAHAATDRVRPSWGTEAIWGYWEFEDQYVPKHDWKIAAVSQEGAPNWTSSKLIDDDSETFYYPNGQDVYTVTIDLGKAYRLGALTFLTLGRPNRAIDSRMAKYEIFVGDAKDPGDKPVAAEAFDAEEGAETVVRFAPAQGRYVTLKAYPRDKVNREVCIRELSLVTSDIVAAHDAAKKSAVGERLKQWEQRNADATAEALGKEFLDLIFCTPEDINRSNLRARPKLEEVGKLKTAHKYADGLRQFRDYYFDKMRRPQSFGLPANDLHAYGRGYAGISDFPQAAMDKDLDAEGLKKQIAAADDLLAGNMMLNGAKVNIGEPGSVDWSAPAPPYGYNAKTRQPHPYRDLWWCNGFNPLFTAYYSTKDERYLKRWLAYMDDWSLNCGFLAELDPVTNHDNALFPGVMTIRMLAAIANSLPFDSDVVPPATFARIMKKVVMESPLTWIVYMRSNGNGWTPGAGGMLFAMMIDEFKVAPLYFRETRRRNIEDINVLQELPDGAETHQWPGYNFLLLLNVGAQRLMDARESLPNWAQPVWEKDLHTVGWQREEMDALLRRASYMIHWGTPNGEYPLVTHQEPPHEKQFKLREFGQSRIPQMLDDPTNAKIYSTLYGDGAAGTPAYTAEWFPYAGYSIARDGWGKQDGYGSMFCSPQPGCGGVGSGCKNNAFSMAAYGMDLLSDDLVHAYVHTTSPIQVDGKRQQLDFYVPKTTWPTGHRGDLIREWSEPAPWRWHASDRFNLMEGNFAGPYVNDFHNRKEFIDDVSHQRLAIYARQAHLWILTDRLATAKPHDYEQLWWLPLRKRDTAGFKPEEIAIDPDARAIKTRRTRTDKWWSWDALRDITVSNVNLSMYQFSEAALKYDSKTSKDGEMYDWQRIGVTWRGEGNQQVVTALFPRKPTPEKSQPDGTENDLKSIEAAKSDPGVNAFEATTPEGFHVSYAAAAGRNARLVAGGLEAMGESLLVVRGPNAGDDVAGVLLGGRELKGRGAMLPITSADFEFSLPVALDGAKFQQTPIYRPISPVKIGPESDVFADAAEISLSCATPEVRITYTLDGTEPTPQSIAYLKPFKIDRTVVVKVRAYRPGVESNPPQTSGTHATPTAMAVFTKKLASLPEAVTPHGDGLAYEYYEGFWRDLWLTPDKQKPVAQGEVREPFDMSVIPADNPLEGPGPGPRHKSYAFKYTGYLDVPADGTYTIHAPHDYVHLDQIPGYELQVYLGHALNPDNNTVKRDSDINFWYPATRLHGFGTWSVPLKKGYHELKIVYIDFRTNAPKRMNKVEGVPDVVWTGDKPDLLISGPGLEKPQPIPAGWLSH